VTLCLSCDEFQGIYVFVAITVKLLQLILSNTRPQWQKAAQGQCVVDVFYCGFSLVLLVTDLAWPDSVIPHPKFPGDVVQNRLQTEQVQLFVSADTPTHAGGNGSVLNACLLAAWCLFFSRIRYTNLPLPYIMETNR
jgi:hypothetical protein